MASYNLIWKTNLTQYASLREVKALGCLAGSINAFFLEFN